MQTLKFIRLTIFCLLFGIVGTNEAGAKRLFSKDIIELMVYCVPGGADPYSEVTYLEAENQIEACTKLIELSPENLDLKKQLAHFYFHRSRLHYIRMDFDKSLSDIEAFRRHHREEEHSGSLALVFADIITALIADKNGNDKKALSLAKGLSEKWVDVRQAQTLYSSLAAYAGQYEEAIKAEQRLLKHWAGRSRAKHIASMYYGIGKSDLSQNTLLSWFSVGATNRDQAQELFLYGKTLNDKKQYDLALTVFENAKKSRRPVTGDGEEAVPAWEANVFKGYPRISARRFRADRYNNHRTNLKEEKAYALFQLGKGAEAVKLLGDGNVKCTNRRCMDVAILKAKFEEDYEEVDRLTTARENSKFSITYSTQRKWDRILVKSLDHLPRERILYGPIKLKTKTATSQLADGITRITVSTKKPYDGRFLEMELMRQVKVQAKKQGKDRYVISNTKFSTSYLKSPNPKQDTFKKKNFVAEVYFWDSTIENLAVNLTPWRVFTVD